MNQLNSEIKFAHKTFNNQVSASQRALIVEDDKNIVILMKQAFLELLGDVQIDLAHSLEEAVQRIIQADQNQKLIPYDLIVVDIFLEGRGTGFDLIKVIHRLYPEIPFLVISSLKFYFVKEHLDEINSENIFYLKKPFLYSQCKQEIKNIMLPSFDFYRNEYR